MERYWVRLTALREASGMSPAQLARKAEISESYVYRIEAGKVKSPSIAVLEKLTTALGVTISDLAEKLVPTDEQSSQRQMRDLVALLAARDQGLMPADVEIGLQKFLTLPSHHRKYIFGLIDILAESHRASEVQ